MSTTYAFLLGAALVALMALAAVFAVRRERRRARERRIAALRTAAACIVHEAKNPIQSILLHADLLEDGAAASDPAARAEICRGMIEESGRLTALLDELAAFARGPESRLGMEPVPLLALLREVATGGAGPAVEIEGDAGTAVLADAHQLRLALSGLIGVARQAVADHPEPRVSARLVDRGRMVELRLSDNGDGIAPERLGDVFEPFASWKGRGLGLGMAAAREIVERHGGRIEVESEPGAGTLVRVLLPVADHSGPIGR